MLSATPFLLFDGNCAEAMRFYHKALGGDLMLTRLGDTSMKTNFQLEKHSWIINAHLVSRAIEISASDWMASPDFDPIAGNTYAIYVTGNILEELQLVFEKLKDGLHNTRLQELHEMPFGIYGQFYDQFSIQWIFRVDKV
jgi:PhnB protein